MQQSNIQKNTNKRQARHNTQPQHNTTLRHTSWPQQLRTMPPPSTTSRKTTRRGVTYDVPNFMPDARDIMRKLPRDPGAESAPTLVRAFRETLGTSLHIVETVWCLLVQEGVLPDKSQPKHLLRALHFMKVYPLQAPGCAAAGASAGGAVDPKTHRKWVWAPSSTRRSLKSSTRW